MTNKSDKEPSSAQADARRRALANASGMSHLRRHVIETRATLPDQTLDPSLLPDVVLPSLEGLHVVVPEPAPITEEDVHEAFDRLAFEAAPRKPRLRGQPIQMGDEVRLDLIGYMGGHLLPMSAHEGLRVILEPDIFMPEFGTSLVGAKVGEAEIVSLEVPADFPIEEARGGEIILAVEVCDAFEVQPLDPNDPELFQIIGLGPDLESTLQAIMLLLLDQRTRTLSQSIISHLLAAIADKVDVTIPDALIEAELKALWSRSEGRFLQEKGIEQEDIEMSWEGWLADEELRVDAAQRLKSGLIMYAIANREGLANDRVALKGFVGDAAKALGVFLMPENRMPPSSFKKREELVDQFVYAQALAYLSQTATIQIGNNPPIQPGADVSVASQVSS